MSKMIYLISICKGISELLMFWGIPLGVVWLVFTIIADLRGGAF